MTKFKAGAWNLELPPLPTPIHWVVLKELIVVLERVGAGMRLLQASDSLACQILPIFNDICNALQQWVIEGILFDRSMVTSIPETTLACMVLAVVVKAPWRINKLEW